MDIVGQLEAAQSKKETPALRPGEAVRVHVKVVEGEKERTQVFEGIVIGLSGSGSHATFTVRKVSYGVGVERDAGAAATPTCGRGGSVHR